MIKRWIKILPVICLLAAQIIVATHIHHIDDAISDQDCCYCQTAAELAGANTPECLTVAEPVYYGTDTDVPFSEQLVSFRLSYRYNPRAPPEA